MSLSRTEVIGRLTKDPEVREVTINGEKQKVANFTVACDEDFGDGVDFYDVVAWRALAVNVEKFLTKGREVYVAGRSKKRSYQAKVQGTDVEYTRDVWEIRADKVQFLGGKPQGGQEAPQATPAASGPAPF